MTALFSQVIDMMGTSIVFGGVAIVTGVIILVVIDSVVATTTFTTSAVLNTIADNIPVLFGVGLLGGAAAVWYQN